MFKDANLKGYIRRFVTGDDILHHTYVLIAPPRLMKSVSPEHFHLWKANTFLILSYCSERTRASVGRLTAEEIHVETAADCPESHRLVAEQPFLAMS